MQLNSNTIVELSEFANASNSSATKLQFFCKKIESIEAGVFDRYKALTLLNLGYNKIKELPQGIFHSLRELKEIYLHCNKISSLHPQLFRENKKLELIVVEANEIIELNEEELFHNLPELKRLDFRSNKIKTFYCQWFNGSPKLAQILFQFNDLREIGELNTVLRLELHKNNKKILAGQQQQSLQFSEGLKNTKEEVKQLIGELKRQQARSDIELKTLKDELTKSNRKIKELETAQDVNKQQNLKLSAELKDTKEEMCKELQRQQASTAAEFKTVREKADEAVSDFTRQVENAKTSCNSRSKMLEDKIRTFYSLSGEIFELDSDFQIFSDNFKEYNEKIETQMRKYEGQITVWTANIETTMKEMHQVMEDHKMSYPQERGLIWEILVELDEHGSKNQESVDGLRGDFEEHSEEYAKQKTKVGEQLYKCEINLDALQTEMAVRGDEMALLYKTERTNIFTRLVKLKRTTDHLLADNLANKDLRALADDDEAIG